MCRTINASMCLFGLVCGYIWHAERCEVRSRYAMAAPAPKPRPRPDIIGVWTAHWWGTTETTYFGPGGFYQSLRASGDIWAGRWSVEGDTLTVDERPVETPDAPVMRYTIRLKPGKWEGVEGERFRLERPKAGQ